MLGTPARKVEPPWLKSFLVTLTRRASCLLHLRGKSRITRRSNRIRHRTAAEAFITMRVFLSDIVDMTVERLPLYFHLDSVFPIANFNIRICESSLPGPTGMYALILRFGIPVNAQAQRLPRSMSDKRRHLGRGQFAS